MRPSSYREDLSWPHWPRVVMSFPRSQGCLDVSSRDLQSCRRKDNPRLQLVIYSLPIPRPDKSWQALTSGMKPCHEGAS